MLHTDRYQPHQQVQLLAGETAGMAGGKAHRVVPWHTAGSKLAMWLVALLDAGNSLTHSVVKGACVPMSDLGTVSATQLGYGSVDVCSASVVQC